jgi:hypothetical protein
MDLIKIRNLMIIREDLNKIRDLIEDPGADLLFEKT